MAKSKPDNTPDADAATSPHSVRAASELLKRLLWWVGGHPLQASIIVGIVLLPVLPIVVAQITLTRRLPKEVVKVELDEAFAALDRGDYPSVAEIVGSLGSERPMTVEELKAKPFLLGVVADHDAGQMLEKQQRRLRAIAAK